MRYGAIDLHKKESQIRIVMDSGEVLDRRIATTRDRLTAMFGEQPPMRLLVEARDRERVGRATPGDARPRSHRGGSEFHADVWAPQPTGQNRSA